MAQALAKQPVENQSGFTDQPEDTARDEQRRAVAGAWLAWQCKMVAGVLRGVVFSVRGKRLNDVLSQWPNTDTPSASLAKVADEALKAGDVLVQSNQRFDDASDQLQDNIAIPVVNDGGEFVVVLHIVARSQAQQQAVAQLVQWGGMWLGSLDTVVNEFSGSKSNVTMQLAEQVLLHNDLYAACLEASNRLAIELQCERVSVGLLKNGATVLQAISQISDFDSKRALVSALESAMDEAITQRSIISHANASNTDLIVMQAHNELQSSHGGMDACTFPLYCNEKAVGAVVLERDSKKGFPTELVGLATKALTPMGPVLQLIKQEQRSMPTRSRDWLRKKFNKENLPNTTKGKAIAGACCLGVLAFLFFPVTHNVSAMASIEGSDKQVLVAPRTGYIQSAHARAGERVQQGQLIASLDARELTIERERWLGEQEKIETTLAKALSERDRSEIGVVHAKKAQIKAELALIDQQISRSELRAPFDGVLVSGDLNQALGSPVDVGQVLFEVASMESYRLMLEVDEHDVAGVESNQKGILRFSALPGNKHALTTTSIVPVAVTKERRSIFMVEASLDEKSSELRPGMRGIAKIEVGKKPLFSIWAHNIVSKLRLWFWKVGL